MLNNEIVLFCMLKSFPYKGKKMKTLENMSLNSDTGQGIGGKRETGQMFCLPETPQGRSTSL